MIAQLKIAVNASAETVSEEEAIALDMIHIYLIKFYQRRYVIPRPIQRSFHIRNVCFFWHILSTHINNIIV